MNISLPEPLTARERDILNGLVEGLTNAEIAERLVLSAETVKWYVKQIYGKLNAHSRDEAVTRAVSLGLVGALYQPEKAAGRADSAEREVPIINALPQDVSGRYIGRADICQMLTERLQHGARLISVIGRAGAGKTALVCKVLADLRRADPMGAPLSGIVALSAEVNGITLRQVLMDLGRLLPERDQAVIDAVARDTEIPTPRKVATALEKIAGHRIVLLLDNLETLQEPASGALSDAGLQGFIEAAVAQSSALTVLITSREPLLLPRALRTWENLISLEDGLPTEDAITLLRRCDPSGLTPLHSTPDAELAELVQQLGGYPRALEAVAGMLLEDPLLDLAAIRHDLETQTGELSAIVVEQALARLHADAVQVLGALAVYGQPVPYEAIAYLLEPVMPDREVRALVGRLIRACFIKTDRVTQRLSLHPLDQRYCYERLARAPRVARSTASAADSATGGSAAVRLHERAATYFQGQRLPPAVWRTAADLQPQLSEFQQWISAGNGDEAAQVLLAIDRDYLWEWGDRDQLARLYETLSHTPIRDAIVNHHVRRRRAWLDFFVDIERSDREFAHLLDDARRLGFRREEADALDDMAQVFRRRTDLRRSADLHRQALAIYREVGDRRGEAEALGGLGVYFTQIDPEEAITCLQPAAEIQRELGNNSSLSFTLITLAEAWFSIGLLDQSLAAGEEALEIARTNRNLLALCRAQGVLAGIYALYGERARAQSVVSEMAQLAREIGSLTVTLTALFWLVRAAPLLWVGGEPTLAIDLIERILPAEPNSNPQMQFANLMVCLARTVAGAFQAARALLPLEAQGILMRSPQNTFWIPALLVKTGERVQAAAWCEALIAASAEPQGPSAAADTPSGDSAPNALHLAIRSLACGVLALVRHDHALAEQSAALARQTVRVQNWSMALNRVLFEYLRQEPGGDILEPIRAIYAAAAVRR